MEIAAQFQVSGEHVTDRLTSFWWSWITDASIELQGLQIITVHTDILHSMRVLLVYVCIWNLYLNFAQVKTPQSIAFN